MCVCLKPLGPIPRSVLGAVAVRQTGPAMPRDGARIACEVAMHRLDRVARWRAEMQMATDSALQPVFVFVEYSCIRFRFVY